MFRKVIQSVYPCSRLLVNDSHQWSRPSAKLACVLNNFSTEAKPNLNKQEVEVTFIKKDGTKITAKGKEGENLLDVVVNNNLDFDGFGACEGTLTCSTCHVILKQADYDRLPDKPSDEECDMLDLAYELTDTSRLGCQVELTKEMNGLEVQLPSSVNDQRAS